MAHLSNLLGGAEQATGRIDVLPPRGAYGGEDTVAGEIIAKLLHPPFICAMQGHIRYLMEANEIDAASQALEELDDLARMVQRIVDTTEDNVLERQAKS